MHVVIIGNGVAGITCAQEVKSRDPDTRVTVVSMETPYFFSRTALMYCFMDVMQRRDLEPFERDSYRNKGIELIQDEVVDCNAEHCALELRQAGKLTYDKLVFAIGAKPNRFPWKGIDQVKDGIVHFVSLQDLDNCERLTPSTREAVVVGGGLIGIELAECLLFHGVKVTFLIREPYFWPMALGAEEATFITAHLRARGLNVVYGDEIAEIQADSSGRVQSVLTSQGRSIPCQMLGVCIGVRPNVSFLENCANAPQPNFGVPINQMLQTADPNIFACGDCAEISLPEQESPINEQTWYAAKRQGALVARNLFGDQEPYRPPIFFNSSKFFDLEFTTVGEVMQAPEGSPTLFLKPDGRDASVRIVHDGEKVLGFNMIGSRWDHETLEDWIAKRRSPADCLRNLQKAQYDVEFGRVRFENVKPLAIPLKHA